jgi:uncharacterized membrane protein
VEVVVFLASLKFFFVEGGEQFIVGIHTAKKIGVKPTIRITIAGITFAVIMFFLLYFSRSLIPTNWLELALGLTLYFFAARMFIEVFEKEDKDKELEEKAFKYGYIAVVSLESVENAAALAALTFIDITGALLGAGISIVTFLILAVNLKRVMSRIPLNTLRLISSILLAITATPLIIYSSGWSAPEWLHWIIPPLQ